MKDELIITLLEKFSTSTVAELDFNDGTAHLILRKESARIGAESIPPTDNVPERADIHLRLPAQTDSGAAPNSQGEPITSPIVATFYAAPRPDAPPFVTPGTTVKAGDTLCILEAMKMMNHLEAEFDCEILTIQAKSGDLVEYGQILFEVKRLP